MVSALKNGPAFSIYYLNVKESTPQVALPRSFLYMPVKRVNILQIHCFFSSSILVPAIRVPPEHIFVSCSEKR